MPGDTQDEERARLLNEIRAYGKGTAPYAHVRPEPHKNVYDESMKEWVRSKTFKTMVTLIIGVPAVLICLIVIGTACLVIWGGSEILSVLNQLVGYGG